MTTSTVRDPSTGILTLVVRCRSCNAAVYWGKTKAGKRCPFDVDEHGEPTEQSHFRSCPDAKQWSKH